MASTELAPKAEVAPSRPRSERAAVLGCLIDRSSLAETVASCMALIESRACAQQVSINVAKLIEIRRNPELRHFVDRCAVVSADGQGIVWASRILGDPLPERVAGIDLMHELLAVAADRGYRVYILGARDDVLRRAVEQIRQRYRSLVLAGYHHGYFGDDEAEAVSELVRAASPDILFVAMSSPRKEYWLSTHAHALGVPFAMGVGGSIDVVAGVTRRAPHWVQRAGLEWLFRVLQEPRRLWRRYLITNARFAVLVAGEAIRSRLPQFAR